MCRVPLLNRTLLLVQCPPLSHFLKFLHRLENSLLSLPFSVQSPFLLVFIGLEGKQSKTSFLYSNKLFNSPYSSSLKECKSGHKPWSPGRVCGRVPDGVVSLEHLHLLTLPPVPNVKSTTEVNVDLTWVTSLYRHIRTFRRVSIESLRVGSTEPRVTLVLGHTEVSSSVVHVSGRDPSLLIVLLNLLDQHDSLY